MAKYDIYYLSVDFQQKRGAKERYAVVLDELEDYVLLLDSITSRYDKKSDFIKAQYYPIVKWKEAGLKKPSYIDIFSGFVRI